MLNTSPNPDPTVIDWTPMLGFPCELRLKHWNDGLTATTVTEDGEEFLELADLGDWLLESPADPLLQWRASIPQDVSAAVAQVPDLKLDLIALARESREASDLLRSTPLLLWLLKARGAPMNSATFARRQTVLLAELGLAGSKQQLKVLRKLGNIRLLRRQVLEACELLKDSGCLKFFSHARALQPSVIDVLMKYPWLASCEARALLEAMASAEVRRIFEDTLRMLDSVEPLRACTSVRALERLHDRLVDEVNRDDDFRLLVRDSSGDVLPLPPPPFPSTERITPLTDQQSILSEGRRMRHCIGTYIERVVSGNYFVYHYEHEEHLTIGMRWHNGHWSLDDVRGRRNRSPEAVDKAYIEKWFSRSISQAK